MIVKKHIDQGKLVLAICDETLLGKRIEDSNLMLDLSSDFYNGTKMSEQEFLKLIKQAYIINAVGQGVVSILQKEDFVSQEQVNFLNNVPYVQIVFEKD